MAVLGKKALKKKLAHKDINKRLYITPLINPENQIGESSIDLRLGNDFIVTKRGNQHSIDLGKEIWEQRPLRKHCTNISEAFYLHPNELVLANTFEFVKLPDDLSGYVTSRSSFGRAGLVIATATIIHPGFSGTITLELINLGQLPIALYPGIPVAQIVLHDCEGGEKYKGNFNNQTDAKSHDLSNDKKNDLDFWTKRLKIGKSET